MERVKRYWNSVNHGIESIIYSPIALYAGSAIIIASNVYYKFFFLDEMHVKHDDAFSIFYAQQSLKELYAQLSLEANPPFYFTLLHFWIKLFGIGPIAVKSLSAVFSVASAIVIFAIGKKHMNLLGAFFAAFLFTFSNIHFDFSHEVRAFSLVFFLGTLSVYFFLLVLNEAKWKWLIVLCLVNALLPYTHYTSVLLPITQFLIALFVLFEDRIKFLKITGAFLLSAILFLPQLLKFKSTIPDESFWLPKPTTNDLDFVLTKLSGHDPSYNLISNLLILGLLLAIIHFFYGVFKKDFDFRKLLLFIAIYFIPIYLNYFIAQYTPVFRLRYMLFAGIGPFLALAYMISKIKLPPILVVAFAIYLIIPFKRGFTHHNHDIFRWDIASAVVAENYQEGYLYFICPPWRLNDLSYYFERDAFADYKNRDERLRRKNFFPIYDAGQMKNLDSDNPIVLILCNPQDTDPDKTIPHALKRHNYSLEKSWFESKEINIELWKKDSLP